MPTPQYALWLDLETTGSKADDTILELGAVLTRNVRDFPLISRIQRLFPHNIEDLFITDVDPTVLAMHATNHLWQDLIDYSNPRSSDKALDSDICEWLADALPPGYTQHVLLAGSGVSHFDRRFISKYLPQLDTKLAYYSLDIGVVRRFMDLQHWHLNTPSGDQATKKHRALADAEQHLNEARQWGHLISTRHE